MATATITTKGQIMIPKTMDEMNKKFRQKLKDRYR
jgi:hypothetical protein